MQHDKVLILDFGSQYTQLIARRVRELNIYCEIHPYNKIPTSIDVYKAVVLSGSPQSVRGDDALHPDLSEIRTKATFGGVLRCAILSPFSRRKCCALKYKRIRSSKFVFYPKKKKCFLMEFQKVAKCG